MDGLRSRRLQVRTLSGILKRRKDLRQTPLIGKGPLVLFVVQNGPPGSRELPRGRQTLRLALWFSYTHKLEGDSDATPIEALVPQGAPRLVRHH